MGYLAAAHRPLERSLGTNWLIAGGMVVQAGGIWLTVQVPVLYGMGDRSLVAGDRNSHGISHAAWRRSAMWHIQSGVRPRWGPYRFWRDLGYALGALISGIIADCWGCGRQITAVAVLTLLSGLQVAI